MRYQSLHLPVRGLGPRRGAARGLPFEAPAGGPFSPWGKFLVAMTLTLMSYRVFFVFSRITVYHTPISFFSG